ncbi:hypothetical protein BJ165DRAFT_1590856 [Panaeolus papilionaceus]|nr:hypothetical protein BJ165DRAFT_1590856 [Panaeolus papilionaceus]
MDFWPKDDRNTSSRQRTTKTPNRDYPYLEPGLIGAARLQNTQTEGLQWDFLVNSSSQENLPPRLKVGRKIQLFSPTRSTPAPLPNTARTTVRQRAEQGANFLRTYLPDVDITADLIREHLTEEANLEKKLEQFDPSSGNVLNVLPNGNFEENLVLFPVGELSRDLNISHIRCKTQSELVFKRWSYPANAYPTPIRQVESSLCAGRGLIAVRTFGDTHISTLHFSADQAEPYPMLQLGTLHTAGHQLVDLYLSRHGVATSVTKKGLVMQYDLTTPQIMHIRSFQQISAADADDFDYWHILPSREDNGCLLLSADRLSRIDLRAQTSIPVFSLPKGRHVLTFAEKLHDNYVTMCSTKEIIWLDTRFPARPLLSLTHGRQYDRTLRLLDLSVMDGRQICALHSRFNSMMTIYDVSKVQDQPLHMNDLPYCLPFETLYNKSVSKAIITHQHVQELLCLGEDGQMTHYPLRVPFHDAESVNVRIIGNTINAELADHQVNQLSQRAYSQVDVSESPILHQVKQGPLEDPEDIRYATDQFPRYLQSTELPTETILTTYDVAFRSGTEPDHFSRNDFLAASIIKSDEGFQALLDGKFAPSLIKAPFKASISKAVSKLGTRHTDDASKLYDDLKRVYLGDSLTSQHTQVQQHIACQQLTMDLALSSTILHEKSISASQGDEQALETMTGALSLTDEPPPYVFGYLKPLEGFAKASYDEERRPLEPPELPISIRLLMKTWDNSSPNDYEYHDPYGADSHPARQKKTSRTPDKPGLSHNIESAQLRPPVMTVPMPPRLVVEPSQKPKPAAQSQDVFATRFGVDSGSQPLGLSQNFGSSQTPFANTQVVAGPFGGRPQLKKKPTKKRIGGF